MVVVVGNFPNVGLLLYGNYHCYFLFTYRSFQGGKVNQPAQQPILVTKKPKGHSFIRVFGSRFFIGFDPQPGYWFQTWRPAWYKGQVRYITAAFWKLRAGAGDYVNFEMKRWWCKSCRHWDMFWHCQNKKVKFPGAPNKDRLDHGYVIIYAMKPVKDTDNFRLEFKTGPHFGCVHWAEIVQHMKREGMIETGQKKEAKP